jgi:hypothetical protein
MSLNRSPFLSVWLILEVELVRKAVKNPSQTHPCHFKAFYKQFQSMNDPVFMAYCKEFQIFIFASNKQREYYSFQGYLASLLLPNSIKVKFLFRGTLQTQIQGRSFAQPKVMLYKTFVCICQLRTEKMMPDEPQIPYKLCNN